MTATCPVAVFLNVGPGTPLERLSDTIESARFWFGADLDLLLAVDDSGDAAVADLLTSLAPAVTRVSTGRSGSGLNGGLFDVTCLAMRTVLELSTADVVLQLDTDALVVGPDAHRRAAQHFAEHPAVGMLGSFRFTCTGDRRDFTPAVEALDRDLARWSSRHVGFTVAIRRVLARARSAGYEPGEHCLGAAYFVSRACLESLAAQGLLDQRNLRHSAMGDDQLLGLVVRSAGWEMGEFAVGDEPLAVQWKGLPWPVEEIQRRGKAIIHSTKDHGDLREVDVRSYFADLRG